MSYRCQHSGKVIGPGIRQFRVVTERRVKQYQKEIRYGRDKGSFEQVEGWEIAKELVVGPEAYEELTGEKAGTITSKSHSVSRDAVVKRERDDNSRPYEPWKKRNNRSFNNARRPQVERVPRYDNRRG